jgi:hypothetical protein
VTQSPQVPGNNELVTRAWEHRLTGIVRQGHDKPSVGMAEGDYEPLVRLSDVADALSTAGARIEALEAERDVLRLEAAELVVAEYATSAATARAETAEAKIEALEAERANLIATKREQIELLTAERDEALSAEDEAKDCFWAIYPEWAKMKGHGISTEAARTKLADRALTAEATIASLRGEVEWQPIETAPKGALIIGWCSHDADPYREGDGLTPYGAGSDALGHVPDGAHVLEWRSDEWEATDDYGSGFVIPGWWTRFGSEGEEYANPTDWRPLPAPPAIRNLKEAGNG